MPESAQSEVAARPEAAEVPGEEKKDLNFPQLLTNGLQGEKRQAVQIQPN